MANDASKQQPPTEYVVLRENGDGTWSAGPPVEARSAHEAIRAGTKDGEGNLEGVYKAIPMRSWKATVKITTRKVVQSQFEDVGAAPAPATMKAPQNSQQIKEPVSA